jgi:hypothetical protein
MFLILFEAVCGAVFSMADTVQGRLLFNFMALVLERELLHCTSGPCIHDNNRHSSHDIFFITKKKKKKKGEEKIGRYEFFQIFFLSTVGCPHMQFLMFPAYL